MESDVCKGETSAVFNMRSFSRLFQTEERDFNRLSAFGAGDVERYRLPHYPFGNGGNHGVNIVQAVVKHLQALIDAFDISLGIFSHRIGFPVLRQIKVSCRI